AGLLVEHRGQLALRGRDALGPALGRPALDGCGAPHGERDEQRAQREQGDAKRTGHISRVVGGLAGRLSVPRLPLRWPTSASPSTWRPRAATCLRARTPARPAARR